MTITYCDITKKPIENATSNYTWDTKERRYDTILDRDLSPEGMRKLQDEIFKEMDTRKTFNFMEHKQVLEDKLRTMTR